MNKKRILQIGIPLLILVVLVVIWFAKKGETPASPPVQISQEGSNSSELVSNEDIELEMTSVDLDKLTSYGLPLIVDFGSDSCGPCRQMAPALQAMHDKMLGKATIKFVDVWKNTDAANGFPLQVIPTQMFLNAEGTPYVPSSAMENSGIEFVMYSYKDTGRHAFTMHQGGLTEDQMRSILTDMGVGK
ncbi:MAG: thioredoxin family protein [Sphaerochaetaceae bacterium]